MVYVTHFYSLVFTLSGRTVHWVGELSSRRSVRVVGEVSSRRSVQLPFQWMANTVRFWGTSWCHIHRFCKSFWHGSPSQITKAVLDLRNLTETGFRFLGIMQSICQIWNRFHETGETFSGDGFVCETVTWLCCYCVLLAVDANFCSSFTVNMRVIQRKSLLLW